MTSGTPSLLARSALLVVQSYRSLRDGKAFDDARLTAIAEKHGRSPAQVMGRWCVQHGYVFIPKSVRVDRIRANLAQIEPLRCGCHNRFEELCAVRDAARG